MIKRITNVNLIASFISANPGCRRVDIKHHLFEARCGKKALRRYELNNGNQYFSSFNQKGNGYLNDLWFNALDTPSKSVYQLTARGRAKVIEPSKLIRPFVEGSFVEWQTTSPNRWGWGPSYDLPYLDYENSYSVFRGLVIERNNTHGMWVLRIDGKPVYLSHQVYVREAVTGDTR